MEVVHIIDTDGAFIDDSMIKHGDVDKIMYNDTGIETNSVDKTISRNKQKRDVVRRMIDITKVLSKVPYSVFYFSSNMDHVLHNNANMTNDEKGNAEDDFDDRYADVDFENGKVRLNLFELKIKNNEDADNIEKTAAININENQIKAQ
jgi:predicted outer membrane protein